MSERDLKKRTKEFAHRCVKLALALPDTVLGNNIKKQLIKCSTSVAANYRAACVAQSKADFVSKLSIVVEEVDESCFWMEFIVEEQLLRPAVIKSKIKKGVNHGKVKRDVSENRCRCETQKGCNVKRQILYSKTFSSRPTSIVSWSDGEKVKIRFE